VFEVPKKSQGEERSTRKVASLAKKSSCSLAADQKRKAADTQRPAATKLLLEKGRKEQTCEDGE